jgi:hypothetical protein
VNGYRPWHDGMLIPDTHEPGKRNHPKTVKQPSSEHQSKANKNVKYWPVGTWAHGFTDPEKKKERR